jgi:hypothetical protein
MIRFICLGGGWGERREKFYRKKDSENRESAERLDPADALTVADAFCCFQTIAPRSAFRGENASVMGSSRDDDEASFFTGS